MEVATTTVIDWTSKRSTASSAPAKQDDNHLMLSLLRLDSWPNLSSVHRDWVGIVQLICTLLEKRPMVGYLVARRLKLPVDKTHTLIQMLHSKGYIAAVSNEAHKSVNSDVPAPRVALPTKIVVRQGGQLSIDYSHKSVPERHEHESLFKTVNREADPKPSGVLDQVWSILNSDITFKRPNRLPAKASSRQDSQSPVDENSEAKEKLNMIWRILETEVTLKKPPQKYVMKTPAIDDLKSLTAESESHLEPASRFDQVWEFLNSEISLAVPSEHGDYEEKR